MPRLAATPAHRVSTKCGTNLRFFLVFIGNPNLLMQLVSILTDHGCSDPLSRGGQEERRVATINGFHALVRHNLKIVERDCHKKSRMKRAAHPSCRRGFTKLVILATNNATLF